MNQTLVFFGSSPFSVVTLRILLDRGIPVSQVVTQPDRPAGRGRKLTPNPVKTLAESALLPVVTDFTAIKPPAGEKWLGLVAAYGRILPPEILDIFSHHIYNIHPSLLPKYRGPSPLQQQILDQITDTGVTIIRIDEQTDHGPVVAQSHDAVRPEDTWMTLGERLFAAGSELFSDLLPRLDSLPELPQDDTQATFTAKITRQAGYTAWEDFYRALDAVDPQLEIRHRAYFGWPGIWTTDPQGRRLKLISWSPEILVQPEGRQPLGWDLFKTSAYD